jgi:ArsR family transcriptional regulator, arsenate/arsenite/antimonite-responsive transcriptional repressor
MKHPNAVAGLAALAQDSRLAIYRLLVKRGPEGFAAGEIALRLDLPGPTLSFHLKALTQASLVEVRRSGRSLNYRANFLRMNELVAYLTENCCSGGSVADPCCVPVASGLKRRIRA